MDSDRLSHESELLRDSTYLIPSVDSTGKKPIRYVRLVTGCDVCSEVNSFVVEPLVHVLVCDPRNTDNPASTGDSVGSSNYSVIEAWRFQSSTDESGSYSLVTVSTAGSIFQLQQKEQVYPTPVTSLKDIGLVPDVDQLDAFVAAAGYTEAAVFHDLPDPPFIHGGWATAQFTALLKFACGLLNVIQVSAQQYGVLNVPCPGSAATADITFQPVMFWFVTLDIASVED
ncbi:hypothetical protein C0991_009474 [Blastosporella zonata]|nr:hypothetical protein C0991_009474 [Blastosporella zonata]